MNNTASRDDTAGRIDASGWDDHDKTDPGFTLSLSAFDAPRPGPMAFAIVADDGCHPDTSHYHLTPLGAEAVDPAELPAIAWVP
jgi:hypothetical protein